MVEITYHYRLDEFQSQGASWLLYIKLLCTSVQPQIGTMSFSTSFSYVIFTLALATLTLTCSADDVKWTPVCQWHNVHLVNGFSTNKKPLTLHCQWKDDDLGEHTLWNGQDSKSTGFISAWTFGIQRSSTAISNGIRSRNTSTFSILQLKAPLRAWKMRSAFG